MNTKIKKRKESWYRTKGRRRQRWKGEFRRLILLSILLSIFKVLNIVLTIYIDHLEDLVRTIMLRTRNIDSNIDRLNAPEEVFLIEKK